MMFIVHDEQGRILYTAEVSDVAGYEALLRSRGERFLEVSAAEAYELAGPGGVVLDACHVDVGGSGALLRRKALPVELGAETLPVGHAMMVKAPPGTTVSIRTDWMEEAFEMADDEDVLIFEVPGRYALRFELFPFLPAVHDVTVTA